MNDDVDLEMAKARAEAMNVIMCDPVAFMMSRGIPRDEDRARRLVKARLKKKRKRAERNKFRRNKA